MSDFYEIDDIEFCYNTAEEGKAAKAEVKKIIAATQARIEKLENVAEKLANIIQWAMDDKEDFIYSTEGMAAIAELDKLKGDQ